VIDYGPPVPLRKGKGGVLKIKRGGTGKVSNSGNAAGRFYTPGRALRGKDGKQLPWPDRGAVIWNPTDPFFANHNCEVPTRRERRKARAWAKAESGFEASEYDEATGKWANIPRDKFDNAKTSTVTAVSGPGMYGEIEVYDDRQAPNA
jgi:hypothetical protein